MSHNTFETATISLSNNISEYASTPKITNEQIYLSIFNDRLLRLRQISDTIKKIKHHKDLLIDIREMINKVNDIGKLITTNMNNCINLYNKKFGWNIKNIVYKNIILDKYELPISIETKVLIDQLYKFINSLYVNYTLFSEYVPKHEKYSVIEKVISDYYINNGKQD